MAWAATPTTTTETTTPTVARIAAEGDGPADVAPLRRQPALGEDEHQSGITENPEWSTRRRTGCLRRVAQGEADAEVDEQRWHPRRHREPHRGNRHEQDDRANEQHACEVVESHSRRRDGRERGHGWLLSWRWTPSNHSYAAELAHTQMAPTAPPAHLGRVA